MKSDGSTVVSQLISKLPNNLRVLLQLDQFARQFCCRKCKRLFEKRQKDVESVQQIEADILKLIREGKGCSKQLFDNCDPAATLTTY